MEFVSILFNKNTYIRRIPSLYHAIFVFENGNIIGFSGISQIVIQEYTIWFYFSIEYERQEIFHNCFFINFNE